MPEELAPCSTCSGYGTINRVRCEDCAGMGVIAEELEDE